MLRIQGDEVEVQGTYEFRIAEGAPDSATLFYPYPREERLGRARTVRVEARSGEESFREVAFTERRPAGVSWVVPLGPGDRVTVRGVYRQELKARYARYIVTTTANWGRPLERARFEIHLPEGAVPAGFSFPFTRDPRSPGNVWVYEARDFMPTRDVTVRWEPPPPDGGTDVQGVRPRPRVGDVLQG